VSGLLWPLLVYAAVVLVVAGIIGLSSVLGQRHRERATAEPYESGIPATASARLNFSARSRGFTLGGGIALAFLALLLLWLGLFPSGLIELIRTTAGTLVRAAVAPGA
jgi:NADH:ubiquinone oxidoreductase subunit 3 (subunit A)